MPKRRVAFQFGDGHEVRYIRELPEVGNHIRVGDELWLVTSVEEDALGTSVICEQLREFGVPDEELRTLREHG